MTEETPTPWWRRWLTEVVPPIFWIVLLVFAGCLILMRAVDGNLTSELVGVSLEWTRAILGMAGLLAGGQQAIRAYRQREVTSTGLTEITPGLIGALVGATLLGIGDWAAPAALGVVGVMHFATQMVAIRAGAKAPAKSTPKKKATS